MTNHLICNDVTRVEVINHDSNPEVDETWTGVDTAYKHRAYTNKQVLEGAEVQIQDDGRTLKIFI